MRTTRKVTISMPAEMAKDAARLAKRENRSVSALMREAFGQYRNAERPAEGPFSEDRIEEIIADAKRNPMTPEEAEAEFRRLSTYGASQAKKLGIKERDIV